MSAKPIAVESAQIKLTARKVLTQPRLDGLAVQANAEVSKALDIRTVTQVPIFDRNHQELVQLLPGVTPPRAIDSVIADPQRNRIWETNGLPNGTNRRTLDGVENDEPFNGLGP